MKNFKKYLIFFALVLALALVFCSCGDKAPYQDYELDDYITLGAFPQIEYSSAELESKIDDEADSLTDMNKTTEAITDRAVIDGDTVNIDYEGKIDGEVFEGGTAEGYDLVIGSDTFIGGFEDGIIGHNIGDEFDLNLTFPQEYENNPDLAGKDVVFSVKVNSISAEVSPEFDDAFVEANTEYKTVEEFRNSKKDELLKTMVWDNLVKECKVEKLPEKEVDKYFNNVVQNYKTYALQSGYTLDKFVAMYGYNSEDDFYNSMLDSVAKQIKEEMILYSIARKNDITVSDDEYKTAGEAKAAELGYENLKEMEKNTTKVSVNQEILKDKIVDILLKNAIAK